MDNQLDVIVTIGGGADGYTPVVGKNGNWWINGIDTKIKADYSSEEQSRDQQEQERIRAEATRQQQELERQRAMLSVLSESSAAIQANNDAVKIVNTTIANLIISI